jgi:antitoxin component of MazEF toxin-antitoxin module
MSGANAAACCYYQKQSTVSISAAITIGIHNNQTMTVKTKERKLTRIHDLLARHGNNV